MIHCTDGSLYTGISTDVQKRYQQHVSQKGAKYFRGRQPQKLVYQESGHNRSSASKREIEIKKLNRVDKIRLVLSSDNQLKNIKNNF